MKFQASRTPAAPASAEAIAKVMTIASETLIPMSPATVGFSAVARIAMPVDVERRNTSSKAISATEVPKMRSWSVETVTGPRSSDADANGAGIATGSAPKSFTTACWRTSPTAIVVISGVTWLPRLRTGRNATRSTTTPRAAAASMAPAERRPGREAGERQRQPDVGAHHEDLAVRQMEQVQHAEDERVADRDERVGAAEHQPVDELLDEHCAR